MGSTGPEDSGDSQRRRRPDYSYVGTILTSIAGLGSVLYVLGVLSVWLPIERTYTQDFVAAWHATSLVPKTVIIGLGIQHLIAVPLIIVAVMTFIIVAVELVLVTPLRRALNRTRVQPPPTVPSHARGKRNKKLKKPPVRQKRRPEQLESRPNSSRLCNWTLIAVDSFVAWGVIGYYIGGRINDNLPDSLQMPLWGTGAITFLTSAALYAIVSESDAIGPPEGTGDAGKIDFWNYSKAYLLATALGASMYLPFTFIVIFLSWYSETSAEPWHPDIGFSLLHPANIDPPSVAELHELLGHLFGAFSAKVIVSTVVFVLAGACMLAVNKIILSDFIGEGGYHKAFLRHHLAIGVMWAFVAAFAFTIISQPPLPEVCVQTSPSLEGDNLLGHKDGTLLAHADGFWYVYDDTHDLVAIRDDEVQAVEYRSKC